MNPYYLNEKDLRPVLIFGSGQLSELAWYCLTHDTPYNVVGFVLDDSYLTETRTLFDLPIIALSTVQTNYPPVDYRFIVPVGFTDINGFRKEKYLMLKEKGYEFVNYFASNSYIWDTSAIGENCLIYEHARVQPFATVGNNVVIRSGVHVSHHCQIESHVFIGAQTAIGGASIVKERAFIGIGATIADATVIEKQCFIGAGAVVVKSTQPGLLYVGNPAKNTEKSSQSVTVSKNASV